MNVSWGFEGCLWRCALLIGLLTLHGGWYSLCRGVSVKDDQRSRRGNENAGELWGVL